MQHLSNINEPNSIISKFRKHFFAENNLNLHFDYNSKVTSSNQRRRIIFWDSYPTKKKNLTDPLHEINMRTLSRDISIKLLDSCTGTVNILYE